MKSVVLYESMFGHTRRIADQIASALESFGEASARSIETAGDDALDADLIVLGAPTHAHSLPSPRSRAEAADWAADPDRHFTLEHRPQDPGLREWLDALGRAPKAWAAFATRVDMPRILAGSGAAAIERRMRRFDVPPLLEGECFLVSMDDGELLVDEPDRARAWGGALGRAAR